MSYKDNVNYQLAIDEAVKRGDYGAAAQLEQARNDKITNSGLNYETTNNYSQYLGQNSTAGSAMYTTTGSDHQDNIKNLMNINSYLWYGADDATKDLLHAENQGLSTALSGTVGFDPNTGYWSNTADSSGGSSGFGMPTWDMSALGDKPTYADEYAARIDEMLNQILNREDFSYDVLNDPLYQQYKTQYNREGNRAMNDTLASAASGAGGMNSYAITAAQQANDYYAAQLTDKIPELYQLAYEMYLDDIDMQVRDLGLLTDMDDTQYGRYRDTMSDWYNDRDFAYNKYRDDVGDYKWQQEFDTSNSQWQQSFDYNASRDAVADSQWQQQFDTSNDQWQQEFDREGEQYEDESERYDYETSYRQAMEMIQAGMMPDADILEAARISEDEARQAILVAGTGLTGASPLASTSSNTGSSGSKSGSATQDDIVAGTGLTTVKVPTSTKNTKTSTEPDWDSAVDLGIGPVNATYITKLMDAGAVVEDDNGAVSWAKGWNASNYKKKLEEVEPIYTLPGFKPSDYLPKYTK